MTLFSKITIGISSLAILGGIACAQHDDTQGGKFTTVSQRPDAGTDFTKAAESTINGVVSIKSFATPRSRYGNNSRGGGGFEFFNDPFFEYFFGGTPRNRQEPRDQTPEDKDEQQQQLGLGSGVIISQDGYIVTNNHVIDGAERLEVTLNDNRSFNAKVIGTDPTTDLALIKIEENNLPVIPIGNSDNLKVGEWVLAVGNPFGFTSTVTTGIVSAKARSIASAAHSRPMGIESYIQTDAAVNPGNSGGALVNLNGELIGINTAIYSQTGNYAGYSFAIPTSIVTKVVNDLQKFGTVQRALLGIGISDLTSKLAKEKGITAVFDGVYVGSVSERSAAKSAGLKEGDVIIAIDGTPTRNTAQLQELVSRHAPGDKVKVTYIRDNTKRTTEVTLLNSQGSTSITKAGTFDDLGCSFKPASEETLKQLGLNHGIQVTDLKDGKFKRAGIKDGCIILEVNGTRVNNQEEMKKLYNSIMQGDDSNKMMFIVGIYPTGKKVPYAIDLSD